MAHVYWQAGTDSAFLGRDSDSPTPQILVTLTGVRSFRRADVMVHVTNPLDALPPAWHVVPGGCNENGGEFRPGGFGGTIYPSLFTSGGPVPNLLTTQNAFYYPPSAWPWQVPDAFTGVAWLSAAGASGVPRDPGQEYALYAFRIHMDDSSFACQGGPHLGSPTDGVRIQPARWDRQTDRTTLGQIQLLDTNNEVDIATVVTAPLYWNLVHDTSLTSVPPGQPGPLTLPRLRAVPQPAIGSIQLEFELPRECGASIQVFDLQGRRMSGGMASRVFPAGRHQWAWRLEGSRGSVSGVYFARIVAAGRQVTTRFVVLR